MPRTIEPPTAHKRKTPPEHGSAHPWRHSVGTRVYVRGWPHDEQWSVIGGELWMGWPHYLLFNRAGETWRVSQLQVSAKPITRK